MRDTNSTRIKSLSNYFQKYISQYLKQNMEDHFKINIGKEKINFFVQSIEQALRANKKIFIYGDYDVDGIGSTAYMYELLRDIAKIEFKQKETHLKYLIPSRNSNYGLDYENYTSYYRKENDLIIILDNGTHSEFFKKLTSDDKNKTLIIDHHPNGDFKDELGVINPNTDGKMGICTGILIEYLFQELRKRYPAFAKERSPGYYMDYTALTLISDMANLNNKIVRNVIDMGLKKIAKRTNALYKMIFKNPRAKITMTDVAFNLIPLLNSAGRLSADPTYAVDVLIEKDINNDQWKRKFNELNLTNKTRKEATTYYYNKFKESIADKKIDDIVIYKLDEDNEKYGVINATGLNGLIAGDIFNVYGKNTVSISESPNGEYYVGSGRGIAIKDHLEGIAKIIEESGIESNTVFSFGGHNRACGVRIFDLKCFENAKDIYLNKNNNIETRELDIISDKTHGLIDFVSFCNIYKKSVKQNIKLNDSFFLVVNAKIIGYKEYARDFMNLTLGEDFINEKGEQNLYVLNIFCKKNDAVDYDNPEKQKIILEVTPNIETKNEQKNNFYEAKNVVSSTVFPYKDGIVKLKKLTMANQKDVADGKAKESKKAEKQSQGRVLKQPSLFAS